MLAVRGIKKHFGEVAALNGITFSIDRGVVVLLGPNGAGKSSLLRVLAGLVSPDEGTVRFGGEDIARLGVRYRDHIGYLPQSFGVFPGMSGRAFLTYLGRLKGVPDSLLFDRVAACAAAVGLSEQVLEAKLAGYSAGMKRGLGLAQALLNDPEILLLDEPFATADPEGRKDIILLLSELARGRIIFLVSHTAADLGDLADEIVILKEGFQLGRWSAEQILAEVADRVFELDREPGKDLPGNMVLVGRKDRGGMVRFRVLAESLPGGRNVSPNLEDAYVYLMKRYA